MVPECDQELALSFKQFIDDVVFLNLVRIYYRVFLPEACNELRDAAHSGHLLVSRFTQGK